VPEEWKVGVYANEVNVWHTPYEFTLDFAVTEPPELDDPDDPDSPITIPNTVTPEFGSRSALCSGFSRRSTRR
jgi:hypothetical protein